QPLLPLGERLAVDLGPEGAAEILDEAQLVIDADPGVLPADRLTREHHVAALVTPQRDGRPLERVVHRLRLRTRGALLVDRQPDLHRDGLKRPRGHEAITVLEALRELLAAGSAHE